MNIIINIPDEYAKPFFDELKMTLKYIDINMEGLNGKDSTKKMGL